jgi:hypothetical protein
MIGYGCASVKTARARNYTRNRTSVQTLVNHCVFLHHFRLQNVYIHKHALTGSEIMGSSLNKTSVIAFVWAGAAIMCFSFAIYGAANDRGVESWVLAFPVLMATLLTSTIWLNTILLESRDVLQKTKRQPSDKLALLKELLDDDELEAFKQALKQNLLEQSDGELLADEETLKALMHKTR